MSRTSALAQTRHVRRRRRSISKAWRRRLRGAAASHSQIQTRVVVFVLRSTVVSDKASARGRLDMERAQLRG